MKTNKRFLVTGLITAAVIAQFASVDAFAAKRKSRHSRKAVSTSEASKSEVQPSFLNKLGATYYGNFYGPAISKFDSNFPNDEGTAAEPMYLYNSAKLTYKLSSQTTAWLNPRWNLRPVPGTADAFSMLDPRIGWTTNDFIKQDTFSISPSIDFEIAATDSSIQKRRVIAPRLWLTNTYAIPNSRWTIGGYLAARYYIRSGTYSGTDPKIATYFAPFVVFQAFPTLGARVMYEAETTLNDRSSPGVVGTVTAINNASPNIQPAILWQVSPAVEFAPYLLMYTSEGINADSTAAGFELSASIF